MLTGENKIYTFSLILNFERVKSKKKKISRYAKKLFRLGGSGKKAWDGSDHPDDFPRHNSRGHHSWLVI